MSGVELYNTILNIPKYKKLYDNNIYFNQQIQYLKRKEIITQNTFINSIAYLSIQLLNTDIAMIQLGDEGGIR